MNEKHSTSIEKVLSATIESLYQNGLSNTTTRVIAKKANTNVSSINYHYKSKDSLLEEALQSIINEIFDWDEIYSLDDIDEKDSIVYALDLIIQTRINCPSNTVILLDQIMQSQFLPVFMNRILSLMSSITDRLIKKNKSPITETSISVSQIFFSVLLPGILQPNLQDSLDCINLFDDKERLAYIRNAVNKLL